MPAEHWIKHEFHLPLHSDLWSKRNGFGSVIAFKEEKVIDEKATQSYLNMVAAIEIRMIKEYTVRYLY